MHSSLVLGFAGAGFNLGLLVADWLVKGDCRKVTAVTLAGLVVGLPGTPNTEETGSLKQPKHIKLDCCYKQLFKDSSLTSNDPQGQHTLISL